MNLTISPRVLDTMAMANVPMAAVVAAYAAHQIDDRGQDCSCGKNFDGIPAPYINHLSGSVAARARVPYRDGQWVVHTISNEAYRAEEAMREAAA